MKTRSVVVVVSAGALGVVAGAVFYVVVLDLAPRWRIADSQVTLRAIREGVTEYRQHTGRLPASLAELGVPVTNREGKTAGPFQIVPRPPRGYSEYRYERKGDEVFTVSITVVDACGRPAVLTTDSAAMPERGACAALARVRWWLQQW